MPQTHEIERHPLSFDKKAAAYQWMFNDLEI